MAKNFSFYEGKYYKGNLTDETCKQLVTLITGYKVVESLKKSIVNLPKYMITDIKRDHQEYEKEHGSLEGFSKVYEKPPKGELEDYQTVGVAFMFYAGSALLGDEVGLGKTVQVAGLANVLKKLYESQNKEFRFLFLAEKSTVGQIQDKLIQFTGDYIGMLESGETTVVEDYLKRNKDKRHYSVVGTHGLLANPLFLTDAYKRPFDLIIVDESSILKNTSTDIYTGAVQLMRVTERKILLNATPLEIDLMEVYNQLDLLDKDMLPTKQEVKSRYTKQKRERYAFKTVGSKNEEEFRQAISLRYIARVRKDLGAKYSENIYRTILVPLSKEQKELKKRTSLRQMLTDFPTGVNKRVPFTPETTPKLAALLGIANEVIGITGGRILVYCRFIEAQNGIKAILEEKGYRVSVLNGTRATSSATKRKKIVDDYNNGLYDVLITNVQRGLDLQTCDACILYSIDPNPQQMVQFEGRMTRSFDVENKALYLLVAMGDEKKFVEETLKMRINTSNKFTVTGKSMVLSAIGKDENKEIFTSDSFGNMDDWELDDE